MERHNERGKAGVQDSPVVLYLVDECKGDLPNGYYFLRHRGYWCLERLREEERSVDGVVVVLVRRERPTLPSGEA